MRVTVKTKGFKELEKILADKLPQATARNVLRRVAKGALEPMADTAARLAPEDEGRLAFSIDVSEGRTRRAKTNFLRIRGVQMAMGPASGLATLQYATFVEFGTIDTPAQPYMRPAWETGKMDALEYVQDNLWREVQAAVGRVQRKGR
jgi:HK97 gp10 family phage protein